MSDSPIQPDQTPAATPAQPQTAPPREDRQRTLWLKDKEKRGGAPKRVKYGLKRKLFMMIVSLIAGLLVSVYLITLQDEEIVLRRELKIRGATVARNLADSIYNSYASLAADKQAKPFDLSIVDPNEPGEQVPLPFSDAMNKAAEQQDFINGYALDPQNRVFIEPGAKRYLVPHKTPAGVFDFKAIYPFKKALEKKIISAGIPVSGLRLAAVSDFATQLKQLRPGIRFELLNVANESARVFLILSNDSYNLEVEQNTRATILRLNFTPAELDRLLTLCLATIRDEAAEFRLFLNNTISDFRKLRRNALLQNDRLILESVFNNLEQKGDNPSLSNAPVLESVKQATPELARLQDESIKKQAQTILTSLKNFILRFNPIVQTLTRRLSEKISEDVLYITYPMCETDKYFSTYRGEVHLLLSQQGIIYTINYAAGKLQLAAALAIVVGTLFTIVMAFFITTPVKKLMTAMHRVGAGDLDQTVYVRVTDEIGVLADNFNEMTEGLREKEKIRNAMNKAVSKEIAEVMLSGELKLGGDNKFITVLFSDIRGFTTISEALSAEEVVSILNEYLTLMTNIIEKHRGIVDKFVGDEIMALWGAPKSYGNDALAAVKTALEMMEVLDRFNDKQRAAGKLPIDIGIGLNTGQVIAANMGSENRMNYTVIGDAVNLGARLEGTNKMYGTHIIISEFTERELRGLIYRRELDLIAVKGKNEPVTIYEVLGLTSEGEAIRTTAG